MSFWPETCFRDGLGVPCHQVQVLRNHRVGRTCNVAGSGPRLHHADLDKEVLRSLLGVFYENIEVAIIVEDTRI